MVGDERLREVAELNYKGDCRYYGSGSDRNFGEAVKFWRRAADLGDDVAWFKLGSCYLKGEGVKRDEAEALKWWRMSADSGNAAAKAALAAHVKNSALSKLKLFLNLLSRLSDQGGDSAQGEGCVEVEFNDEVIDQLFAIGLIDRDAAHKTELETVRIPASYESKDGVKRRITKIGVRAFDDCALLSSVTIPDGVTAIGEEAFSGCESLSSIVIPKSVKFIGDFAFYRCKSLSSVDVPYGVSRLGFEVFFGCGSLKCVTLPDSLSSIGHWAFNECGSLSSLTVPDSVEEIDEDAFYDLPNVNVNLGLPKRKGRFRANYPWGAKKINGKKP